METIRGRVILLLLCVYPFYAYIIVWHLHMIPEYVSGLVIYGLFIELLITKFRNNETLRIPGYVSILAIFTLYLFLSKIFISDIVADIGIAKYLYRDDFLRTIVALLIIENTRFDKKAINLALHLLFGILLIASVVSIIQIEQPLFFRNGEWLNGYGSIEKYEEYVSQLGPDYDDAVTHVKEGYRFSIYSWTNGISVGLDALAIFSILWGIKSLSKIKKILLLISAGFISILSSSRWIILNFFIVFSQRIFRSRKPVVYSLLLIPVLVASIFAIIWGAQYFGFDYNQFFKERLLSKSAGTRFYAFEVFGRVYPHNPIFGTGGADTSEMLRLIQGKTSQIHVGWLKLLYYYGLIGGLIYLAFIVSILRHLYNEALRSRYWGSFFAILAFVIANFTLVELSIFYHGLLLAMLFSRQLRNQPDSSHSSDLALDFSDAIPLNRLANQLK
ncbi:MAG: hypothetical protein IPL46_27400 [Saprospiraceae bacterium]|nr:hypothetical protein [Saprospiraceae bacterium]